MYLLGLDVGTTHCKAILIEPDGKLVASASERTPTVELKPGWVEHDPEMLWHAVVTCVTRVIERAGGAGAGTRVKALSVGSMAETGLPLDRDGRPVRPFISWYDTRNEPQTRKWLTDSAKWCLAQSLTGILPSTKASITKISWLRENEPGSVEKMWKWANAADFVIYRLCGVLATDYSLAGRTMGFDLRNRRWSAELLEQEDLDPSIFPEAHPSGTTIGEINRQASEVTGIKRGTPVVLGGHDHLCAAFGAGVVRPGMAFDSSGTAESHVAPCYEPLGEPAGRAGFNWGRHVVPEVFCALGAFNASGGSVEWWNDEILRARDLAGSETPADRYRVFLEDLSRAPRQPSGLMYFPYLLGSGPPGKRPGEGAAFLGLKGRPDRSVLSTALVEGLCYESRRVLDGLQSVTGVEIREIRLTGGATKNPRWCELKATISGRPVAIPEVVEGVSFGAALLAGLGAGLYRDAFEAVEAAVRIERLVEPDGTLVSRYNRWYEEVYLPGTELVRQFNDLINRL